MGAKRSLKFWRYLAAFAAVAAVAVPFLLFGPPKLLARSESPDFCASCHVMQAEYEAWAHTGAHRRKACIDCHLPNDNLALHYAWKSLDGVKDIALFYSGMAHERATISEHGMQVLQGNCIRCHGSTAQFIDPERKCWECHRRLRHRWSGVQSGV